MWIETKEYRIWCNIKQRCYNTNHPQYKDYGGRGITLYEGWLDNPNLFCSYILSLGECPPGWQLDRAENDYGYEPMNLRWAPRKVQIDNRRAPQCDHIVDYPLGETGFKWVTRTKVGLESYKGQFSYKNKRYRTKTFYTPEQAHEEVLRMRTEMGLTC